MSVLARTSGPSAEPRLIRIQPSKRLVELHLRDLWEYRELLFFLAWRDIKVRYKQTSLGVGWAVIQPLSAMLIFSVVFGKYAGFEGEYGVPYPLFVFAALLPWQYFASSLTQSSISIVSNSALVTKVYFPRLLIPLASIVVPIIDFLLAFVILVGMFVYYGRVPHWHVVVTPFFLGMALLTALGMGLWLSALNVRYRDVPYLLPFLTQIWLFASPVVYGVTLFPENLRWLLALNPMTGVIDGFRWAVLGRGVPHYDVFAISYAVAILLVLTGLTYFRHVERRFADVI